MATSSSRRSAPPAAVQVRPDLRPPPPRRTLMLCSSRPLRSRRIAQRARSAELLRSNRGSARRSARRSPTRATSQAGGHDFITRRRRQVRGRHAGRPHPQDVGGLPLLRSTSSPSRPLQRPAGLPSPRQAPPRTACATPSPPPAPTPRAPTSRPRRGQQLRTSTATPRRARSRHPLPQLRRPIHVPPFGAPMAMVVMMIASAIASVCHRRVLPPAASHDWGPQGLAPDLRRHLGLAGLAGGGASSPSEIVRRYLAACGRGPRVVSCLAAMLRITHTRGRLAPAVEHFAAERLRVGGAPTTADLDFGANGDGRGVAPGHAEIRWERGAWPAVLDLGGPRRGPTSTGPRSPCKAAPERGRRDHARRGRAEFQVELVEAGAGLPRARLQAGRRRGCVDLETAQRMG